VLEGKEKDLYVIVRVLASYYRHCS